MVGRSFAQNFGSKVIGLWPGCIEGEKDFSCGIRFNIKGICPTYAFHFGLSINLDNKINIEIMRNILFKRYKNVYAIFSR